METSLYDVILTLSFLSFAAFIFWLILRNPQTVYIEKEKESKNEQPLFSQPPLWTHYEYEYSGPSCVGNNFMEMWKGLGKYCPSPAEVEKMTPEEATEAFNECIRKYQEELENET